MFHGPHHFTFYCSNGDPQTFGDLHGFQMFGVVKQKHRPRRRLHVREFAFDQTKEFPRPQIEVVIYDGITFRLIHLRQRDMVFCLAGTIFPTKIAENVQRFTIRNTQFKMNITPESLKGIWGGYFDIPSFYRAVNSAYASYHHTYGAQSEPSVYKSLYRLADGLPDASGQNTAISGAIEINFKQAFLRHPDMPAKNNGHQNTASLPAPVQR